MVRHAVGLRIGSVLARSLRIWARNVLPLTATSLLLLAPILAYVLFAPFESEVEQALSQWLLGFLPAFHLLALAGLSAGRVLRQLQGERAGSAGDGTASIGRPALAAVTGGFVFGLVPALVIVLSEVSTGFLLLSVLAVIIECRFFVLAPVAVLERAGAFGSFRRAAFLTAGVRASIFGLVLLVGALSLAIRRSVEALGERFWDAADEWDEWRIANALWLFGGALAACLTSVAMTVVYHDLRAQKDEVDVHEVAAVFG